jgi:CheY-like chemotaxis protein
MMPKQTHRYALTALVVAGIVVMAGLIYTISVARNLMLVQGAGLFVAVFGVVLVIVIAIRATVVASGVRAGPATILVVDDDIRMSNACREVLRDAGYRVMVARDAEEGARILRTNRNAIRLVIVDWILPGISGKELIDQMLAIKPAIKIIFFTGQVVDEVTRRHLQPKVHGFLKKPFSRYQLLSLAEKALAGAES